MEFINLALSNLLNISIFAKVICKLFDSKISKKYIKYMFIAEFLCLCIVNSLHYTSFNAIIVLLMNTILLLLCYQGKLTIKVYVTFVYVCFGMILEIFSFLFIHYLFKIGYDCIRLDNVYYLIGTLSSSLFLFLIMSMFSKFIVSLSNTKYPRKTILLLSLPITSFLFVISMQNLDNILVDNNLTIILIFIGLLISNILSFYIFFDIIEIVEENSSIKLKESYRKIDELNYQLLENKYDSTRSFMHDIKKHVNTIDQLIKLNAFDELLSYIEELNEEIGETDYTIQTNQKILNIVIDQHMSTLEKGKIRLKLDIDDVDISNLSLFEQNIIFSNLIENAIESCNRCFTSKNIIFKIKDGKKHIIFKLINSCSNINFINGFPETLKEDKINHGLGLKKVKNIIEDHKGKMIFEFNKELQTFYTSIILPKENKNEIH